MKNDIIKQVFLCITLSLPLNIFCWGGSSELDKEWSCTFKNMGGTLPNDACAIREFLGRVKAIKKDVNLNKKDEQDSVTNQNSETKELGRAYIFYGDSGVGKTTTAKLISEESDVLLEFHIAKEITEEICATNNPTKIITKIYRDAEVRANKENKAVIVVIDEIDKIFKDNPGAVGAICSALCGEIDAHKYKPYILTVLTSNTVRMPDYSLFRRCIQVQWFKPSQKNREEIIKFFAKKNNIELSPDFVKNMAAKTVDFAGAHFEYAFIKASDNSTVLNEKVIERGIERVRMEMNADKVSAKQRIVHVVLVEYPEYFAIACFGIAYCVADYVYYRSTGKHLPRPGGKKVEK